MRKQDFNKAVSTMGYTSFRIDLNFAFMIYYQLVKESGFKGGKGKTGVD